MRARAIGLGLACALLATAPGCYQTRYVNVYATPPSADPAKAEIGATIVGGSQPFYLFGGVPSVTRIDTAAICGDGEVQELRTQRTFGQGFLSVLTFGIYSPYTGETLCTWHWR